jgi:hypothetical protein
MIIKVLTYIKIFQLLKDVLSAKALINRKLKAYRI